MMADAARKSPCFVSPHGWLLIHTIASTTAKAGTGAGAVVVAGTVAAGVQQGWSWLEIGLAGFVAAGLATAIVLLIKKFRT